MSLSKEEKFPLTYAILKDLYHTQMGRQILVSKYCWVKDTYVLATEEQRNVNLQLALNDVTQPIWSIVEDVLLGDYEIEIPSINTIKFSITIAEQNFEVDLASYMCVQSPILPNVTNNSTERMLFVGALRQIFKYETADKYREQLLAHYEEKEKESEV